MSNEIDKLRLMLTTYIENCKAKVRQLREQLIAVEGELQGLREAEDVINKCIKQ